MKKKIAVVVGLLLTLTIVLAACSKPPELSAISIPADMMDIELEVGETTVVELAKTYSKDDISEEQIAEALTAASLVWASSDESIVSVEPDGHGGGTVKAVAPGQVQVTVSSEGNEELSGTFNVTVLVPAVPLESIDVEDEIVLTIKGEELGSHELSAKYSPADADDIKITYEIADEDVATVDADGKITAVAPGKTVLTTTVIGLGEDKKPVEKTAETVITVIIAPTGIGLDAMSGWIYVNGNYQLNAYLLPAEADEGTFMYKSSDESVATVSESGYITGLKAGSATITVTCEEDPELSAEYEIMVKTYSTGNTGSSTGKGSSGGTSGGGGSTGSSNENTGGSGGGGESSGGGTTPAPAPAPGGDGSGNPVPAPVPETENPADWNPDSGKPKPLDPLEPGDPTHGGDAGGF